MSRNIDHIFYINLDHRVDRRREIESELSGFNLPYERYTAIETPGFGILGCSNSHLGVLKLAKERGYKNVLIFEDDFQFKISKSEFEHQLDKLFSIPIQIDICMLGYALNRGEVSQEYPWITRVYDAQTMSGYLVNHSMYDKLIDLYEWAFPLLANTKEHWKYACDQVWKRLQSDAQWYCFTERMGVQRPSYSDNSEHFEDYKC